MFNTFEIISLGISVAAMATALYLLQLQGVFGPGAEQPAAVSAQPGLVSVDERGEDAGAWASAITDASTDRGELRDLIVDDVTIGTGAAVAEGDTVTVHYTGRLQNGQEFDSSYSRGEPFTFTVGSDSVIAGWEQGVLGMQTGGERILIIPPRLAYGRDGYGPIPGNATLLFAIELIAIE